MIQPENVEKIEDVRVWIADHDGRASVETEANHNWKLQMHNRVDSISKRLRSVETRMIFFAGAAASVGSFSGYFIAYFLSK